MAAMVKIGLRGVALLWGMAVSVAPGAISDLPPPLAPAAESYKLPISPPRDQGESDTCWIFAALSMLETDYRVRHPGAHVEFSRGALQRFAIADRLRRLVAGEPKHLDDGGLAVEALDLIRRHGLWSDEDFDGLIESEPLYRKLEQALPALPDAAARLAAVEAALPPLPAMTTLEGAPTTPQALAEAVMGGRVWREYDLSADGQERVGPSPDPDARPDTRVHFAPLSKLVSLIHASLKRGEAVAWGSTDHALLIFGADYDARGEPLSYWIKDSEPPYVYRAAADDIHKQLNDVTVTDAPAATAAD